MKLWHVRVDLGRFIVRAPTEDAAITLAVTAAWEYDDRPEAERRRLSEADELPIDGEPSVLNEDYS